MLSCAPQKFIETNGSVPCFRREGCRLPATASAPTWEGNWPANFCPSVSYIAGIHLVSSQSTKWTKRVPAPVDRLRTKRSRDLSWWKRHPAEHPYSGNPQYSTAFDTKSVLSVSGSTATSKGRLTEL
uniref:Uncharacterized protein n=1 Tax=Toxoplasma gondii COUG TaxID=1074873 RepID=A0A2G8XW24_TOXGO|nr:hypothetical protein TGCOUG_214835 [Toxoplasma gondii COUG]